MGPNGFYTGKFDEGQTGRVTRRVADGMVQESTEEIIVELARLTRR